MSADQARHRIVRDELAATVNGFWVAKELLGCFPPTGSPRHMRQASSRYLPVGRVGALAVSLGIGFALYNSATGVAFAAETDAASSSGAYRSGDDPGTSDSGEDSDQGDESTDDDTGVVDNGQDEELDVDDSDDQDEQEPRAEIVDSDPDKPEGDPGGDYGPPNTPQIQSDTDTDTDTDADADQTEPQEVTAPPAAVVEPPAAIHPAVESIQPDGAAPSQTVEVNVFAPEEESVEETDVIKMAVSNVISPLVNTESPIQSAVTDTLLAWVRRLISHTFFNRTPVISDVTTSEFLGTRTITINATDPNGDPLTYEVVTGPSKGVLIPGLVAGTFTYLPNPMELLGGTYTETLKFRVRDDSEHLTGVYGTIQSFLENVARWLGVAKADTVETKEISFTVRAADIELGLPPMVTASGGKTYRLGSSGIAPITAVSISDIDSNYVTGATVSVKTDDLLFSKFVTGDKLSFTDTAEITGVYDDNAGVLTLSGTATEAAYEAALKTVTFTATQVVERFLGLGPVGRTLSIVVTDDSGASNSLFPARASVAVAKAAPGVAPTVTLSGTPTYTLGGSGVAALPAVTINDADSTLLSGAKVIVKSSALLGSVVSGDELNFTDTAQITGSYSTSTGVLTLSGNATLSQYRAALESVTFTATQNLTERTLTVTVTDDTNRGSASATASLEIANSAAPSVSISGSPTFILGKPAVAALPSVTITDTDSITLTGAKVTVRTNGLFGSFVSGDKLNFGNVDGISGNYNTSTGVLTLSGSASVALYKTALESVTFSATQGGGLLGALLDRTVVVIVTDEANRTSDEAASSISVSNPVKPSVLLSGTTTFVVGYSKVVALPSVTINDSDSPILSGAKVTVRNDDLLFPDYVSGDTLDFTNQNGISIVSNTNGVLTLTGNATAAHYKAALESITFSATKVIDGLLGGTVPRNLTVTVTDELGLTSDARTGTVKVVRPTAPSASVSGGTPTYTVGKAGVVVLPTVTIADSESTTLTRATVTVRKDDFLFPDFVSGDKLNFTNQNGITGVYNTSTGVLTLTGTASLDNYTTALQSVTFTATQVIDGLIGGAVGRTITFTVTDETNLTSDPSSASVDVVRSVAPTVSLSGGSQTVVLGKAGVVVLPTVTITDADSTVLTGAKVQVKAAPALVPVHISGDTLTFDSQNGISIVSNTGGVLTLAGNATLAQYKAALQSITFSATSPGGLFGALIDRTFTVTVTDDSTATSSEVTRTVAIANPAPPTLSVSGAAPTYLFGRSGVRLLPTVTIGDSDSMTLSGAKVTVVGTILGFPSSFVSGDALGFTNQNGISIASNVDGVLTLTGTATLAQYTAALESITFSATQGGGTFGAFVDRAVTVMVTDETNRTSDEVSRSARVDNPASATVSVSGSTPTYLIGRAGVVALPSVTIDDSDSAEIAGARVSVRTDEFFSTVVASDVLGFDNSNVWGISGSYSGGVLTLTGTTSVTNYELALASIRFTTTTNTVDRRLSITVTGAADGNVASSEVSRTVKVGNTVTPTVSPSTTTPTFYLTKSSPLVALPGVTVSDPDSALLSAASVTVRAGSTVVGSDVLAFNNSNAWGIAGTFSNGVMSLTGSASAASYQAALQSITFAAATNTTTRTLTVTVTSPDDTTPTDTATALIAVSNPVAPTVTLTGTDPVQLFGPSSTVILDGAARTVIGGAAIIDLDSAVMSKAVVMVRTTGGSLVASDALAFTAANGITIQSNIGGVLTLVGSATKAAYKAALESVTLRVVDGGGLFGAPTGRTVSVTLTDELGSTGATSTLPVSVSLF